MCEHHTDPFSQLAELRRRLQTRGFDVELVLPDADDPLGGVMTVSGGDFDPVQIVNDYNPLSGDRNPGGDAVATVIDWEETGLRVVSWSHLEAIRADIEP